jgi:hypothetical protein
LPGIKETQLVDKPMLRRTHGCSVVMSPNNYSRRVGSNLRAHWEG